MTKEFETELKKIYEKKELYTSKIDKIKLKRAQIIERCLLSKSYDALLKDDIIWDITGRFSPYFIDYIQEKEKLEDRIIKKRFRKEKRETHPQIRILKKLVLDSIKHTLYYPYNDPDYFDNKTPVILLPKEKWEQIKDVLFLIKKHIKDYILTHRREELDELKNQFEMLVKKEEQEE